ncbi:MAG: extradiol dioxygenase [Woeseiaceae bacterium]
MMVGAHSILYSKNPEADRAFFKDVIGLDSTDVGGGWLIFGLPPSELAVHPSEKNTSHEFFLMCEEIQAFTALMAEQGIDCTDIQEEVWGLLVYVTLPGGGRLGVYEARHERPERKSES